MTKPLCDRCNRPATVEEIDGSMFCAEHKLEEMRLREYAKVRLYAEGAHEESAMGPWKMEPTDPTV